LGTAIVYAFSISKVKHYFHNYLNLERILSKNVEVLFEERGFLKNINYRLRDNVFVGIYAT